MRQFKLDQRVKIDAPMDDRLQGFTGTVVRLLRRNDSAWIKTDQDLPDALRVFPVGDDRANHVRMWPEECMPLKEGSKA